MVLSDALAAAAALLLLYALYVVKCALRINLFRASLPVPVPRRLVRALRAGMERVRRDRRCR